MEVKMKKLLKLSILSLIIFKTFAFDAQNLVLNFKNNPDEAQSTIISLFQKINNFAGTRTVEGCIINTLPELLATENLSLSNLPVPNNIDQDSINKTLLTLSQAYKNNESSEIINNAILNLRIALPALKNRDVAWNAIKTLSKENNHVAYAVNTLLGGNLESLKNNINTRFAGMIHNQRGSLAWLVSTVNDPVLLQVLFAYGIDQNILNEDLINSEQVENIKPLIKDII